MSTLNEKLEYEISWHTCEISTIRKLLMSNGLDEIQNKFIKKYLVVALYSLWQSFVVKCMHHYIEEINNCDLKLDQINLKILTHTIDSNLQLGDGRKYFDKKCNLIEHIYNYIKTENLKITKQIPARSNINYIELHQIFECFAFKSYLNEKYHTEINLFIKVRNNVAHGEFGIDVDNDMINQYSDLVINLMSETALIISNEFENKTYLKS